MHPFIEHLLDGYDWDDRSGSNDKLSPQLPRPPEQTPEPEKEIHGFEEQAGPAQHQQAQQLHNEANNEEIKKSLISRGRDIVNVAKEGQLEHMLFAREIARRMGPEYALPLPQVRQRRNRK